MPHISSIPLEILFKSNRILWISCASREIGLHVAVRVVVGVRELRHQQVGHEDRGQEDEDTERHGHNEGHLLHLLHHASRVDPLSHWKEIGIRKYLTYLYF